MNEEEKVVDTPVEEPGYLAAQKVEIKYTFARFHRRVFANLLDFFIFALVFVGLFLGCRGITMATPAYQQNETSLMDTRVESGLYVRQNNGITVDVVSYLSIVEYKFDGYNKMVRSEEAIDHFVQFVEDHSGTEAAKTVMADYDKYRENKDWLYEGKPYFLRQGEAVVRNQECTLPYVDYFEKVYAPYIDSHCQGYLITLVPEYLNMVRAESYFLYFAELLPAYVVAPFIAYLMPMLIFRRGRMTFGKAMYRIGTVDKNLMVPSIGRTLARFFIFYGAEVLLAPFTFAIPFLVSASLMAFSRSHQGLPDYFLSLYEVDVTNDKIFFSREEIVLSGVGGEKKPLDFKPTYED